MLCDGVCMRNMHRLLDGVYLFVVGQHKLVAVIGWMQ
jgi:hypothetical protein